MTAGADVVDLALIRANGAQGSSYMSPPKPRQVVPGAAPPSGERGYTSEAAYYSIRGELFDYRKPTVVDIDRMLDHDPYAHALEAAMTLPILGAPLKFEPTAGDTGEADFVTHNLLSAPHEPGAMTTPMPVVMQQMGGAFFRRRAYFEKVWDVVDGGPYDGAHYLRKLAWRPPATCHVVVDDNGSFGGFAQEGFRAPNKKLKEYFGPDKAFVYIHDQATRPLEGRGAGDVAYTQYVDKLKIKRLWFAFCQDVALGTLVGTYTGGDPRGEDAMLEKLRTMRGGGAAVKGIGETIERLESSSTGSAFMDALHFLNGEMGVSVLAMFLGLGKQGDRGSWALSKDQSDFFVLSLQAKLVEMAAALRDYVVAPLVQVNFGEDAKVPTAKFGNISEAAKEKARTLYSTIAVAPQHNVKPWFFEYIQNLTVEDMGGDPKELQKQAPEDETAGQPVAGPVAPALPPGATPASGKPATPEGATSAGTEGTEGGTATAAAEGTLPEGFEPAFQALIGHLENGKGIKPAGSTPAPGEGK